MQEMYGPTIKEMAIEGKSTTDIINELGIDYRENLRFYQGAIGYAIRGNNQGSCVYRGLLNDEELKVREQKLDIFSHRRDGLVSHMKEISNKGIEARGRRIWDDVEENFLLRMSNMPIGFNSRGYNCMFLANCINEMFYGGNEFRTAKSVSVKLRKLGACDRGDKITLENSMFNE